MHRLPDLPFGNATAEVVTDHKVATEAILATLPLVTYIDSRKSAGFAAKAASRRVGKISIFAKSITPVKAQIEDSPGWHLTVPFYGAAEWNAERSHMALEGGRSAGLMPNMRSSIESTTSMIVVASLDIAKLCGTVDAIIGGDPGQYRIDEQPQSIDMRRQRETFPAFQYLCSLIDVTASDPHFAHVLGIEDSLYRWTVHALGLLPQVAVRLQSEARELHRIDVVCDLVRSAHERGFTLTEMECLSGLSARALQYAFKARFGCSPMEWQRRERMQLARSRLLFGGTGETITQIAYAMGYSSSAAFTAQYRRYYSKTPSQSQRPDD